MAGKAKRQPRRGFQGKKDSSSKRINDDNERISKVIEKLTDNDVRWYAKNPELLRAAASLPFSQTTGLPLQWASSPQSGFAQLTTVPGVMVLNWIPAFGNDGLTALNSAAKSTYSFVVHANSRNTSYEAADMMLVIISGMQVFAAIAKAIRAYGLMRVYDQRNNYLPKALVEASGFNFQDLQSNLSQMWFDINEIIARSQQIWIPNVFPMIQRWYWLNTNVYMDSESVKGQYYMFNQESFLGYGETTPFISWMKANGSVSGPLSQVVPRTDPWIMNCKNTRTWAQFKTVLNGMIDALVNSEDRGVIMGDILKAYGSERIYALSPLPVDYTVTPVYNKEVLTQIENSVSMPAKYIALYQPTGTQELNYLWTGWSTARTGKVASDFYIPERQVLNFHQKELPTPEQVMVATRLKSLGSTFVNNISDQAIEVHPTEIASEMVQTIYFSSYQAGSLTFQQYYQNAAALDGNNSIYAELAFDWAPWRYAVQAGDGATWGTTNADDIKAMAFGAYGDFDYYTLIDEITLNKMNTTAIYSLWDVPTIS